MKVFNIRKAKYANSLVASGVANRWNKEEEFVLYTGSSIALSVLELLAHRSGIQIGQGYKLLTLELDVDEEDIQRIQALDLPKDWRSIKSYPVLQEIGSNWYQSSRKLLMEVPSAIVPWENNFLINTRHSLFEKKVSLAKVEDFEWDNRLL